MATARKSTLLDLVQAVNQFATSDDELVAVVASLVNSGKVQLCGNFAGAKIDLPTPAYVAPSLHWRATAWLRAAVHVAAQ